MFPGFIREAGAEYWFESDQQWLPVIHACEWQM